MRTRNEIKKDILKQALAYLKARKDYDDNPCDTDEETAQHMIQEDAYLSAMERMEELYDELLEASK